MKKDLRKIFLCLFFFAMANGLFYNFQELWMMENNIGLNLVSIIYFIASLCTMCLVIIFSLIITKEKIKQYTSIFMLIKTTVIMLAYLLSFGKMRFIIALLVIVDYAVDTQIFAAMYPMISLIHKSNKNYAKKDIIYFTAYYLGVIFTTFTLKKTFGFLTFTYNSYNLLAAISLLIAILLLSTLDLKQYVTHQTTNSSARNFSLLIKKIKKDKISKLYFCAVTIKDISINSIIGMIMVILTQNLGYSEHLSSLYWLVAGIFSVFISTMTLNFLTFKNDYINVSLVVLTRLVFYLLAIFLNIKWMFLLAICYAKLTSISYTHVLDAPYINRMQKRFHLAFSNLKEVFGYLGKGIGIFLGGLMLQKDLRLNFIVAIFFLILEIILRFDMINLLKKEQTNDRQ